jgi:hypothetical protein
MCDYGKAFGEEGTFVAVMIFSFNHTYIATKVAKWNIITKQKMNVAIIKMSFPQKKQRHFCTVWL